MSIKPSELATIRDIVYFDESKAASLHSQLVGGLTTEMVSNEQNDVQKSKGAEIDARLLSAQFLNSRSSGTSYSETRILHHDILGRLEYLLFDKGFAIDLNQAVANNPMDGSLLRDLIKDVSYIRIESPAIFHDHSRLIDITRQFPQLVEFISRCATRGIRKSEGYTLVSTQIAELKKQVKDEKNRNKRAKLEQSVKKLERDLNAVIENATGEEMPESWLLEGLSNWINLFNPEHLHARFAVPNANDGSQVVANLRRDCFDDSDFDQIVFAYGRKTNVHLTLLGLVTSMPQQPMQKGAKDEIQAIREVESDLRVFENAFANVFDSIDGIERFALVDNYPNIKVHPVSIYRSVSSYFDSNGRQLPVAD